MKIGFIGVGAMGSGMVRNLLKNGFDVMAFDINPRNVEAIIADGAKQAQTIKEAAQYGEVTMSSLPSVRALEDVALGANGVINSMAAETHFIDMSTVDPGTIQNIDQVAKRRGVKVMDAPVSGSTPRSDAGTLTFMVGGSEEDFNYCRSIFDAMGKFIFHCGDVGSGQVVKLCNNMMCATSIITLGEALITGVKAGVKLETIAKVIRTGTGSNYVLEKMADNDILIGDYNPKFALKLMHKDLGLFNKMTEQYEINSVMGQLCYQLYKSAKNNGMGERDFTAVCQYLEQMSNAKIGTIK